MNLDSILDRSAISSSQHQYFVPVRLDPLLDVVGSSVKGQCVPTYIAICKGHGTKSCEDIPHCLPSVHSMWVSQCCPIVSMSLLSCLANRQAQANESLHPTSLLICMYIIPHSLSVSSMWSIGSIFSRLLSQDHSRRLTPFHCKATWLILL